MKKYALIDFMVSTTNLYNYFAIDKHDYHHSTQSFKSCQKKKKTIKSIEQNMTIIISE